MPVIWMCACNWGCQPGTSAEELDPQPIHDQAEPDTHRRLLDGRIVPGNATKMHAVKNSFRVGGWSGRGSWIKLVHLVPDGKEVEAGEIVARFDFRWERAKAWITERLQKARADAEKSGIDLECELRAMKVEEQKLAIEAERAAVDTLKEKAVSARQMEFYRILQKIAQFEAQAVGQRVVALEKHLEAEKAYHEKNLARVESDMVRYHAYESRFQLRAPHAGVIRHAYNKRERRKMQKGDGLPAGDVVLSIARDESLAVRFFVPEHRRDEVQPGQMVVAVDIGTDVEYPAVVRRAEPIPQELGFLLENDRLPQAREKAFAVMAEFEKTPENLKAGNEVKVRLR
jgi:hypothetical protein